MPTFKLKNKGSQILVHNQTAPLEVEVEFPGLGKRTMKNFLPETKKGIVPLKRGEALTDEILALPIGAEVPFTITDKLKNADNPDWFECKLDAQFFASTIQPSDTKK
tara:strand:- start:3404 stop:3724 length:321 start_codon:yes stop_codon:yes gene_type:complete